MKIKILAFGIIADITGKSEWTMENIHHTDELKKHLENLYPRLKNRKYVIAVNLAITSGNFELTDGATVALMPSFSGG
ncbi:MAG: MoaD/ThiS family protein [Sphingobacteriales bacterium]|nr:MAG: MoaD/ThiS family protein [Sphingobacteriales bacterium]